MVSSKIIMNTRLRYVFILIRFPTIHDLLRYNYFNFVHASSIYKDFCMLILFNTLLIYLIYFIPLTYRFI